MKRNRAVCILLLCIMLATWLPHAAGAAEEATVDADRFMGGTVSAENATLLSTSTGSLLVSFRGAVPKLRVTTSLPENASSGNALRIVLQNDSYCNLMQVTYRQKGVFYERQIPIERRSGKQDYFLYVENAVGITDMQIVLLGGTSGTVELFGLGFVSVYDDSAEQPGEITECTYLAESKTVTVSGNIKHEIVSGTRGAKVALYAFGLNDRVGKTLLEGASPIATTPFSVRFEFSVSAISFSERFMQYVVAIVDNDGEILHWYTPTVPCSPSVSTGAEPAFKGVSTVHGSFAASADAGMAIVDVYLDRMQSAKNNGLLHQADGVYFYVDRSYIYELDEIIEQYNKDGCRVYLRFLLSGGSDYNVLHGSTPSSVHTVYNGISLSSELARSTLYAYAEFLCRRYAEEGKERIHGVVLGYSVDLASSYNYVGNKTLAEYTEIYATALYVISEAAKQSHVEIDLVMPLSDRYDRDGCALGMGDEYPTRLLLVSLCKLIEDRFGGAFSLRVLLEGTAMPARISETFDSTKAFVDNLSEWENTLTLLAKRYGLLHETYLYRWSPDKSISVEDLSRAYVYSYYKLTAGQAASFILNPDGIEDAAILRSLFKTVKYVNTQLGKPSNQEILFGLGAISWSELIPGIDEREVLTQNLYLYKTPTFPVSSIRGSYVMWDYQQGRSVYDWFASTDCSSPRVDDVEGMGRGLVVTVTGEEACSEIVYSYSANEIMGVVDMLSVDIMILGEEGQTYDLAFEVCSDNSSCLVNAELESGKRTTLYISTLQLDKSDRVRNIRFFTSPTVYEGEPYQLCVGHLSAHSNSLDDEDLEKAILGARLASMDEPEMQEDPQEPAWQLTVGLIILLLVVSAAIVVTLARRNDE